MFLLFDAGASKIRVAVSADGQSFSEPRIIPTPATAPEIAGLIRQTAEELAGDQSVQAVIGGISRKLAAVESLLQNSFACPVHIYNDTALVGLGEAVAGAGQGKKLVVYITVSSGVGGVRIVAGEIDQAVIGFEPGHQIINLTGPVQILEDYVSGIAVEREMREAPASINDQAFWSAKAKLLAIGVYNSLLHWSPEVVVLGGSMMKQPGIGLAEVDRYLQELNHILPHLPELKLGTLGDFGGLHGALAQLKVIHLVAGEASS